MTYDEFCERLEWYFSRRDIEELNRLGYEEAKDALTDELTADEIISDETIFEHYAGIGFVEDDFFCNLESNERND